MSKEDQKTLKEDLNTIDDLEVEALDDDELEEVSGGVADTLVASCKCCCVGCS